MCVGHKVDTNQLACWCLSVQNVSAHGTCTHQLVLSLVVEHPFLPISRPSTGILTIFNDASFVYVYMHRLSFLRSIALIFSCVYTASSVRPNYECSYTKPPSIVILMEQRCMHLCGLTTEVAYELLSPKG